MSEYCGELSCFAFLPCTLHSLRTSESSVLLRSRLESLSSSLTLAASTQQGRYVVVKEEQNVKAQDILLTSTAPYAFGLDPRLGLFTCSNCFCVSDVPFERRCTVCEGSAWCGDVCAAKDHADHLEVCDSFRRINAQKNRSFPDSAFLVVRALLKNKKESIFQYGLWEGEDREVKRVYAQSLMYVLCPLFLKQTNANVELIMYILNVSSLNSFGLYDGRFANEDMADSRRGLALYPMFSFFNHSCVPNSVFTLSGGGQFCVVALENLQSGDAVTLRYGGPLDDDASVRRTTLLEKYGFWCECARCKSDADCRMQADCPCLCGGIALRDPLSHSIICSRRCAPSMYSVLHPNSARAPHFDEWLSHE